MNQTLALAPLRYEPPAIRWVGDPARVRSYLLFVIVGLSFAAALAWAAYCVSRGGDPEISFGWTGFKIACYR